MHTFIRKSSVSEPAGGKGQSGARRPARAWRALGAGLALNWLVHSAALATAADAVRVARKNLKANMAAWRRIASRLEGL